MCSYFQTEIPYKPNDEFKLDLDYKFKQRPAPDISTFQFNESREEHDKREHGSGPLPYLIINFKLLKLSEDEVRVRAVNNTGDVIVTKKAAVGTSFKIDLGFTTDMKDKITSHEYTIFFLSSKKKAVSRIHLVVTDDGAFLVNGEQRGKF